MKKLTTIIILLILMQSTQHLSAQSWSLTGNSATNPSTQFLGTTDNKALKLRTNNSVRLTISSAGKVGIGTASPAFKLDIKGGSINTDSVYRLGGITVLSIKGGGNAFTGADAGKSNTTGYFNAAIGAYALLSNTTGAYNTANGAYVLEFNTTGEANTADGAFALNANTTGSFNSANGTQALQFNTTGHDNTANGYLALYSNTTGSYNSAFGTYSLYVNSTGGYNTASGVDALHSNTIGSYNTANGYQALYSNTQSYYNTASGYQALYSNTDGNYNTATGGFALQNNTSGTFNTAFGYWSLNLNTGNSNTGVGYVSLANTTSAEYNTAVGIYAGSLWDNGYNNVFVGANTGTNASGYYNVIAVGQGTTCTNVNQARFGNTATTSYGGWAGWSNLSDSRFKSQIQNNVPGLEFINKLRPVTYHLEAAKLDEFLHKNAPMNLSEEGKKIYDKALKEKEAITYTGFIAQEVEKAATELDFDFSGVDKPGNDNDPYGLRYAEFVVPLVKAVQELDSNQKSDVESLQSAVYSLQKENAELKSEIQSIKSAIGNSQFKINTDAQSQTSDFKLQTPFLGQNIPNPFDNSTLIPFSIPKDCNGGSIMITNTSTSQVISVIPISCNEDHVSVDASTLAGGTYSYALFVDGKLIDKKEMVITK